MWWLLILALASGCAGLGHEPELIPMSLDTAAIVGEQAIDTNMIYRQLCSVQALPLPRCDAWRLFYVEFQAHYLPLMRVYQAARLHGQTSEIQETARKIQSLSNRLLIYSVAVQGRKLVGPWM